MPLNTECILIKKLHLMRRHAGHEPSTEFSIYSWTRLQNKLKDRAAQLPAADDGRQ